MAEGWHDFSRQGNFEELVHELESGLPQLLQPAASASTIALQSPLGARYVVALHLVPSATTSATGLSRDLLADHTFGAPDATSITTWFGFADCASRFLVITSEATDAFLSDISRSHARLLLSVGRIAISQARSHQDRHGNDASSKGAHSSSAVPLPLFLPVLTQVFERSRGAFIGHAQLHHGTAAAVSYTYRADAVRLQPTSALPDLPVLGTLPGLVRHFASKLYHPGDILVGAPGLPLHVDPSAPLEVLVKACRMRVSCCMHYTRCVSGGGVVLRVGDAGTKNSTRPPPSAVCNIQVAALWSDDLRARVATSTAEPVPQVPHALHVPAYPPSPSHVTTSALLAAAELRIRVQWRKHASTARTNITVPYAADLQYQEIAGADCGLLQVLGCSVVDAADAAVACTALITRSSDATDAAIAQTPLSTSMPFGCCAASIRLMCVVQALRALLVRQSSPVPVGESGGQHSPDGCAYEAGDAQLRSLHQHTEAAIAATMAAAARAAVSDGAAVHGGDGTARHTANDSEAAGEAIQHSESTAPQPADAETAADTADDDWHSAVDDDSDTKRADAEEAEEVEPGADEEAADADTTAVQRADVGATEGLASTYVRPSRGRVRQVADRVATTGVRTVGTVVRGVRAVESARAAAVTGAVGAVTRGARGAWTTANRYLSGSKGMLEAGGDITHYASLADVEAVAAVARMHALAPPPTARQADNNGAKGAPAGSCLAVFVRAAATLCMHALTGVSGVMAQGAAAQVASGTPGPNGAGALKPDFLGLPHGNLLRWAADADNSIAEDVTVRRQVIATVCLHVLCVCWRALVHELRRQWETHTAVQSADATAPSESSIDTSQCLLQQKLQLLSVCIAGASSSGIVSGELRLLRPSVIHPVSSPSATDRGLAANAVAACTTITVSAQLGDTVAASSPDWVAVPDCFLLGPLLVDAASTSASTTTAAAVTAEQSTVTSLHLVPLRAPTVQADVLMTEDEVHQAAAAWSRLHLPMEGDGGTGADTSTCTVRSLNAAMSAFKAANPLGHWLDFVRWRFPQSALHDGPSRVTLPGSRVNVTHIAGSSSLASLQQLNDAVDAIVRDVHVPGGSVYSFSWVVQQGAARLLVQPARRSSATGTASASSTSTTADLPAWLDGWATIPAVAARLQRPLFDPVVAAESVLNELETMTVLQVLTQVLAVAATDAVIHSDSLAVTAPQAEMLRAALQACNSAPTTATDPLRRSEHLPGLQQGDAAALLSAALADLYTAGKRAQLLNRLLPSAPSIITSMSAAGTQRTSHSHASHDADGWSECTDYTPAGNDREAACVVRLLQHLQAQSAVLQSHVQSVPRIVSSREDAAAESVAMPADCSTVIIHSDLYRGFLPSLLDDASQRPTLQHRLYAAVNGDALRLATAIGEA